MKGKLTLQQRLILPILLLGLVTLLSNILAVFSINNVNANAGVIVDEYMVSEAELEKIRHAMMNIHRLALSHIIAADHATMIQLVNEIKTEEAELDKKLTDYKIYISEEDKGTYDTLLEAYDSFKHSLVSLVCASADSKTQEAYAVANGDVADYSNMVAVHRQRRQEVISLLSILSPCLSVWRRLLPEFSWYLQLFVL